MAWPRLREARRMGSGRRRAVMVRRASAARDDGSTVLDVACRYFGSPMWATLNSLSFSPCGCLRQRWCLTQATCALGHWTVTSSYCGLYTWQAPFAFQRRAQAFLEVAMDLPTPPSARKYGELHGGTNRFSESSANSCTTKGWEGSARLS